MIPSVSQTTKKFFLISFTVTTAMVVLAGFLFFELVDRTRQYEENLRLLAEGVERQKDVDKALRIIQASEEERSGLVDYSLNTNEAASFLETIEQYAIANSLKLTTGQLDVDVDERVQVEMLRIPYELEGTERDILNFLLVLETLPYFSYVESFSISTNERSAPNFSATIEVLIKYHEL